MEKTFHMLVYRAFHAQRNYLRGCLGKVGLGSGQPKLLGYLAQNGPSCQRQIADYFEIDPAAVSRMLDSLCKSGFVSRRVDEKNRRADVLELTGKRPPGARPLERAMRAGGTGDAAGLLRCRAGAVCRLSHAGVSKF